MAAAEPRQDLAELLRCPQCGATPELEGNVPRCPRCGHCGGEGPPIAGDHAQLYDPVFELAWQVTRGWNTGRAFLHACVRRFFDTDGVVIDLGSGRRPSYVPLFRRQPQLYLRADGYAQLDPDLLVDLECPMPLRDEVADGVILFNVLEHVYHDTALIREIHRLLKPGGKLYLYVPYLIRVHGSPCDFRRYTSFALHRLLTDAGFAQVQAYANGGFAKFVPEVYKKLGKIGVGYLLYPLTAALFGLDSLVGLVTGGALHKRLPCGFFVIARKP